MWAGTSPSAGPPTTSNCAAPRSKLLPIATTKPAASPPGTGRPRCTWRRSRYPASSPRRWREERGADPAGGPTPRRRETQRAGVSFATSKLSSISTLFGSVTKICRRETEHLLVEANGVAQVAGRDVVVVEHTDAHAHRTSPSRLLLRRSD